jgi:hypothetical protein
MVNLHGGTVLGVATTAVLNTVGATYLQGTGLAILSALFLGVMFLSTLLAVATIVRFFRNQRRIDLHASVANAKREWVIAHTRSQLFAESS